MAESEMVERVAFALFEDAAFGGPGLPGQRAGRTTFWERLPDDDFTGEDQDYVTNGRNTYRRQARAALEAMREPTQEMIDAGVTADRGATLGAMFANAHRASIDAALGQEGTEG